MAGTPAARRDATQAQNETNDWMRDRKAQLQAQQQAEAAGRQAWASSSRTGENLQAPQPGDVRALGSRGAQTPSAAPDDSGVSPSPLQAASDAFSNFQKGPAIPRPNLAESFVPVIGPGWEAVADLQQGNYGGAALNGALAASDLFLVGSIAKGGVYVTKRGGSYSWPIVRGWMEGKGFIQAGQHGHHWAIPQNQWGKDIPDWIKNQPWNIKPMPDWATHMRIHGLFGQPKFNPLQRYWHGAPGWWKAANASAAGHGVGASASHSDQPR